MTYYWTQVGQISSVVLLLAALGAVIGIVFLLIGLFNDYDGRQSVRAWLGIAALVAYIIFGGAFGFWLAAQTGIEFA